jgi:hypothetical protein
VQSEEKTIEGVNFSIHHAEAKVSNSMCKDKMHERYICGDSENFTVGLLICIMECGGYRPLCPVRLSVPMRNLGEPKFLNWQQTGVKLT